MRFRSTGLGNTELRAEPAGLEPDGSLLILHLKTTSPVRWHIRAGIQRQDLLKLVKLAFQPKVIRYCLVNLFKGSSQKEPENF